MTAEPLARCAHQACPRFWTCRRGFITPDPAAHAWVTPPPADSLAHDCPHFIADYRLANCEGGSCRL